MKTGAFETKTSGEVTACFSIKPAALLAAALLAAAWPGTYAAEGQGAFLSLVRQLTFEGRRSGEGYFSADGSRLIFQSEREAGNPFYQIYTLDFETLSLIHI